MPLPDLERVQRSGFATGVPLASAEDRSVSSALRNLEMVRTAATGERCIGIHLLHRPDPDPARGQRGYPLLTIWARRAWLRRCYLVFPATVTGNDIQFRLDFFYHGPLDEFLLAATELDRVVDSLTLLERNTPSQEVLPRNLRVQETVIPVGQVIAGMDFEAASCPPPYLPQVLTNQSFYLVEMANESPEQRDQLLGLAIWRLDQALALWPGYGHAHQEKAYILSRLRDYRRAFEASEDAVRVDPYNPKFRTTWVANQLHAMAESSSPPPWCRPFDELEREVKRLQSDFPDYPSAHFEEARLLILKGAPQSEWEKCLAEAARRYLSLHVMPSGKPPAARDIVATMMQNTLFCCALAQRLGQNS
jgi:hypothetical protein